MQALESVKLCGGLNVHVNSFVNEFVALLPTATSGDSNGIHNNAARINPTDGTPLLWRNVSMMVKRKQCYLQWGL